MGLEFWTPDMTNVSDNFSSVLFLYMLGFTLSFLSAIYGLHRVNKKDYMYVNKLEWVN